jgi:hypothetical protein
MELNPGTILRRRLCGSWPMVKDDVFRVDQCLFGYSDGHRLLESSIRLSADIASDLTAASDLAPGAHFAGSDGYWTGFPVPRLSRYSLMYTWPAPEMPRPGCVWTHMLLLDPKLFEELDDLSGFDALMRRPATPDDRASYARPIAIPSSADRFLDGQQASVAFCDFDGNSTTEVLEVLYGGREGPVEVSRPGELDRLVLAVWSQQWPRLRRNFRFQTAASMGPEGAEKRFDLQMRLGLGSTRNPRVLSGTDAEWLCVSVDDIERSSDHRLRTFLWRYGQDVKRQRGSFRPLAQLFTIVEFKANRSSVNVPKSICGWFPEPDDALTLKHDLIDGIIFEDLQVDAILYLCEADKGRSLPVPSGAGLQNLARHWSARSADMMRLAEWAAIDYGELAANLLSTIAKVIPASDFWRATEGFPEARLRLVANDPYLLDSERIATLDSVSLIKLLDAVPKNHPVGAALVRRLPLPVDERVIEKALERFPADVLMQAIETANVSGVEAAEDWLRATVVIPSRILDSRIMGKARKTSLLLAIADALGWLSDEVLAHGLQPWIEGLTNSQDDLRQIERDRFEAFLFALAVSMGGERAQDVFERSFSYLHDRIIHSHLSGPAKEILRPKMPSASFVRDWDDGLKLRIAVAQAYVRFNLDTASFDRLVQEKDVRKMLRKAADEVPGGERFSHVLRA